MVVSAAKAALAKKRGIGNRIPRKTLRDFDYRHTSEARFEVPLAERIATIRNRKREESARAAFRPPPMNRATEHHALCLSRVYFRSVSG